jgi:hypothetical protein
VYKFEKCVFFIYNVVILLFNILCAQKLPSMELKGLKVSLSDPEVPVGAGECLKSTNGAQNCSCPEGHFGTYPHCSCVEENTAYFGNRSNNTSTFCKVFKVGGNGLFKGIDQ